MALFDDDPLPSMTITVRSNGPTSPLKRFFQPIPHSPTWRQYRALKLLWVTGRETETNVIVLTLVCLWQLLTSAFVKWEIQ